MPIKKLTANDKTLILELYKAYYTATESAHIINCSYATIRSLYRGFKASGIARHDRKQLISEEVLNGSTRLAG